MDGIVEIDTEVRGDTVINVKEMRNLTDKGGVW
jgi:hypothetical protein